jgi:hypothetical protein
VVGLFSLLGRTAHSAEWAAWAQAVLTATAVFLSAWLQDRSLKKRDEATLVVNRMAAVSVITAAGERMRVLAVGLRMEDLDGRTVTILAAPKALLSVDRTVAAFPAQLIAERQGIVQFLGEGEFACAQTAKNLDAFASQLDDKAKALIDGYGLIGFD